MLVISIVLGIVEGLTEFVPISSTGHLILVSTLLEFKGKRAEAFEVFIQLGAILAVVWEFRARLWRVATGVVVGGESLGPSEWLVGRARGWRHARRRAFSLEFCDLIYLSKKTVLLDFFSYKM